MDSHWLDLRIFIKAARYEALTSQTVLHFLGHTSKSAHPVIGRRATQTARSSPSSFRVAVLRRSSKIPGVIARQFR